MNPPEARTAFLTLLQLEAVIEQAATTSLQTWLDIAAAAALPGLTAAADDTEEDGGVPPDIAALIAAAVVWETIVDRDLLPRIDIAMIRLAGTYAERLTGWRTRHLAAVRGRLLSPPQTAVQRVTAAVEEERQTGGRVGRMRARARDILSWGRGQWQGWANNVGRTEAAPAAAGTTLAVAEVITASERAEGEPIIDRRKLWWSMRDDRVRATHRHAHGQSQRLADPFLVGGVSMQMPGDTSAPPEETYGCRCVLLIDTGAQVASATPVGGTGMQTFRARIIPLGEFGRTQGWMLAAGVELVDTVVPQAMKWQRSADPAHEGAFTVAAIEEYAIEDGWVVGVGTMLDSPEAAEAKQQLEAGVTRPSVELVGRSEVLVDAAGNPVSMETAEMMAAEGLRVGMRIDMAEIVAVTLVSVPEFRDASMTFADAEPDHAAPTLSLVAASVVEETYDERLFDNPLLDEPVPVHLTDDGRVVGYLATWGTCHVGRKDRCVEPPHSKTGYAYFHQSSVKLDSGDRLPVGRLTVGGGHARPGVGVAAASEHYDNVATVWAKGRAGEDDIGIWFAGVLDPDAPPEMVRKALGTPHSGHWEPVGGNPEMIAACGVNSPGYPIMQRTRNSRGELAMVASFAPPATQLDTSILDEVANRAVHAYVEAQAGIERAGRARELVTAQGGRRRVLADRIRESHARRKAS